jgi:hypothetical protein
MIITDNDLDDAIQLVAQPLPSANIHLLHFDSASRPKLLPGWQGGSVNYFQFNLYLSQIGMLGMHPDQNPKSSRPLLTSAFQ